MTEVVIDSSFALCWLFQDEASGETDAAFDDILQEKLIAVVPGLFYLEVANTVLQGEKRGRCSRAEGDRFLRTIIALPLKVRDIAGDQLARVVALARDHNLTSYDAAYLHLSQASGLPLRTKDRQLLAASRAS